MQLISIYTLFVIGFLTLQTAISKHRKSNLDSSTIQICWNSKEPSGKLNDHRYQLVFVDQLTVVELQCNDCKNSEAVILDAIVWKRSNLTTIRNESLSGTDLFQEGIVQPMNNITISETNSMVIKGTTEVHSNQLYECRDNRTDTSFGYLLIVWQEKPSAKFGNLADWSEYRENVVEPTNGILQSITTDPNDFDPELLFLWQEWEPCVCGPTKHSPNHQYRNGNCAILVNEYIDLVNSIVEQKILLPCHPSTGLLNSWYPIYVDTVKNMKSFRQYKECYEKCIPNVNRFEMHNVSTIRLEVKYGSSFMVPCPPLSAGSNITTDDEVIWMHKGKVIATNNIPSEIVSEKEHTVITVDALQQLRIAEARSVVAGRYTCMVNDVVSSNFEVIVRAKEILTEEQVDLFEDFTLVIIGCCFAYCMIVVFMAKFRYSPKK